MNVVADTPHTRATESTPARTIWEDPRILGFLAILTIIGSIAPVLTVIAWVFNRWKRRRGAIDGELDIELSMRPSVTSVENQEPEYSREAASELARELLCRSYEYVSLF